MAAERLISADSHVMIPVAAVRERIPSKLRDPLDAAIASGAQRQLDLSGDKVLDTSKFITAAFSDPRHRGEPGQTPRARARHRGHERGDPSGAVRDASRLRAPSACRPDASREARYTLRVSGRRTNGMRRSVLVW